MGALLHLPIGALEQRRGYTFKVRIQDFPLLAVRNMRASPGIMAAGRSVGLADSFERPLVTIRWADRTDGGTKWQRRQPTERTNGQGRMEWTGVPDEPVLHSIFIYT